MPLVEPVTMAHLSLQHFDPPLSDRLVARSRIGVKLRSGKRRLARSPRRGC
jgi:hypothetical protein